MNIEIAPKEYHIKCTYEEAILYCFSLNIDGISGWRLPTRSEWINNYIFGWHQTKFKKTYMMTCIPVRDIRNG